MTRLPLIFTLLLIAFVPLANAGVGEVYYCVQDSGDLIEADAGRTDYSFDYKFTMKWLEDRIIKKSSYSESSMPVLFSTEEAFTAGKTDSQQIEHWSLLDGRFQWVFSIHDSDSSHVMVVNATCDKFD